MAVEQSRRQSVYGVSDFSVLEIIVCRSILMFVLQVVLRGRDTRPKYTMLQKVESSEVSNAVEVDEM